MAMINNPPFIKDVEQSLFTWFTQVYVLCFSIQESGTTANRPTKNVWLGRRYYDTTLNKPVYVSAVNPIVFRDATGVVV